MTKKGKWIKSELARRPSDTKSGGSVVSTLYHRWSIDMVSDFGRILHSVRAKLCFQRRNMVSIWSIQTYPLQ